MNRQQAVALLQEFLGLTKDTDIRSISIEQKGADNFVLKIDCHSRLNISAFIEPVVAREKLVLKEDDGFFIVLSQG